MRRSLYGDVDLVLSLPEIFPIVSEFEVFEFNPFLNDLHCAVSLTLNCLNSSKWVSSFNGADNYGNQIHNSRYVWEEPKRAGFINSVSKDEACLCFGNNALQQQH